MKKTITLFIICLFNWLYTQNLSVAYEVNLRPDKSKSDYYESDICLLDIIDSKSYFYSPLYHNQDKRLEAFGNNEKLKADALKSLKTTYIITKDYQSDIMTHYLKLDETYAYQDNSHLDWKIEKQDTMNLLGYNCFKATTTFRGRDYIAYFTDEIPISEGPYKFKGLPGLILKVSSTDNDYSFTAVGLERKSEELNLDLKNNIMVSRKEYLKLMKDLAKDPSKNQKLKDSSNDTNYKTFIGGKEVTKEEKYKLFNKMIWDFMKTHNNPIEKDDIWIR